MKILQLDENYFRIAEKRIDEAIKNADMVEQADTTDLKSVAKT